MGKKEKTKIKTGWLKYVLGLLALAVLVDLFLVVKPIWQKAYEENENPIGDYKELVVGKTKVMVEIRDDDKGSELGLSHRKELKEGTGMLFVFNQKRKALFWMKSMNFGLDFVWIAGGRVVDIHENVPSPTKEDPVVKTVMPKMEVDGVLEVPVGFVSKNNIRVGDEIRLNNS